MEERLYAKYARVERNQLPSSVRVTRTYVRKFEPRRQKQKTSGR